jgi:hypothetical protein
MNGLLKMDNTDIRKLCILYSLDKIRYEELPLIAENLLVHNINSPSLLQLAICQSLYSSDLIDLFIKAIQELGFHIPSQDEAAIEMSKEISKAIVNQEIDEYSGSMKIYKEILIDLKHIPDILMPFYSNASVIEDCITDTEIWGSNNDDIISRSKKEILTASIELLKYKAEEI